MLVFACCTCGLAGLVPHNVLIDGTQLRAKYAHHRFLSSLPPCLSCASSAGCLASLLPYGPHASEHCVLSAGLDPRRQPASAPLSPEERAALLGGVRQWEAWLDACEDSGTPPEGIILTKPAPQQDKAAKQQQEQQVQAAAATAQEGGGGGAGDSAAAVDAGAAVYEDFEPLLLRQHQHKPAIHYPTFDAALEEFLGKVSWGGQWGCVDRWTSTQAARQADTYATCLLMECVA